MRIWDSDYITFNYNFSEFNEKFHSQIRSILSIVIQPECKMQPVFRVYMLIVRVHCAGMCVWMVRACVCMQKHFLSFLSYKFPQILLLCFIYRLFYC